MPALTEYVTTDEAAEALGYSPEHVRRMLRNGKLKADKIGGAWLVLRRSVRDYQEAVRGMAKHDPRRGLE
jgi:excisionase family DNA binding protein